MSFLAHAVLMAVYAALAGAAATFAPPVLPAATGGSLAYGALAFAVLAVVHAAITGISARRAAEREIDELRFTVDDVMRELSVARAEALQIHDAIRQSSGGAKSEAMSRVVDEVKVLKSLIEQLATSGPAAPAEAVRASAVPSAAPSAHYVAPETLEVLDDEAVLDLVRRGLEENRVDLYLQPVVSLPQRQRRFYECFTRIRDAHGRVVLPEQYIPVAEREGLIAVIDNILLFRTVQLVRQTQKMEKSVRFSCNISAHTQTYNTLFPEFTAILSENPELPRSLIFEFSQADIADLAPEAAQNLLQLGEMGFRFALDRVSRMDMNFAELSRRFFRYVKIEAGPLIEHLRAIEDQGALPAFNDELERSALDLVAEKIEDEHTLVEVLDYKVSFGQGYLFGEPRLAKSV